MSRRAVWLTLFLATPAFADGLPFDCASLKAVVAEAPTRFNKIAGETVSQENAAGLAARLGVPLAQVDRDYASRVMTADTPLPGAKHCEVVDAWQGDADARVSQIAHVCRYPGISKLSAQFRAQLAQCLGRPLDPDADADASAVAIDIDTVVSDEGYANTQVTADAQPVDGLRISVLQTLCEARRLGGCDDEEVD